MLLSLTLSNNQTLYQFLRATETPLAVVAEPNKLNELLKKHGLESLDLSDEDFQKEITFAKFLKNEYGNNFTDTLYWDYRDDLSATAQETILKDALQNDTSFENEATWYVQENMEWLPDYEKLMSSMKETPTSRKMTTSISNSSTIILKQTTMSKHYFETLRPKI